MGISLYDVSVSNFLQTLGGAGHFLKKAAKHFGEQGVDPNEIVEARVYPDMLPFRFQIQSIVHHSVDAIEAIKNGTFNVVSNKPQHDYAGLQGYVEEAQAALQKLTRQEVEACEGNEVAVPLGPNTLKFSAADFVMSFSLPNFHFHATTAYDILRSKGVPLGKRDYMGRVRLKQ